MGMMDLRVSWDIQPSGRVAANIRGTGMHGTLETYASATGIAITAIKCWMKIQRQPSLMRKYTQGGDHSESMLPMLLKKEDKICSRMSITFTGQILGRSVSQTL
jgi:glucokinase